MKPSHCRFQSERLRYSFASLFNKKMLVLSMKILILSNNAGGLYSFRKEVLTALNEENEVSFCVPYTRYADKLADLGLRFIMCDVLKRRSTNPISDLKLLSFYKRLLDREKPDMVLTYTIKPNSYGGMVCASKKIPYIANVTGIGTSIDNGGLLSFISKTMYKKGLKNAHCVFFQNRSNHDLFVREKLTRGKTTVIPGSGVNLNEHCAEPYPDDSDGVRFMFAGRVMKDKGIDELIAAFMAVKAEFPNAYLDICGPYEENYAKLFNSFDKDSGIIYHGPQSDIHSFYKRTHCVVLPSYHEGTSNVMLEASATARPVITTRVPGCVETFDEGRTGFGCEAKSVESLARALRSVMSISNARREEMGLAARAKMEREYDRSIVVQAYLDEVQSLKTVRR